MILSVVLLIIAISNGTVTPGTHTHSVLAETFDVLVTAFLIPVPFAYYSIYRARTPRLSPLAMLLGATTLIALTILNLLFVSEVLWFGDAWVYYVYGGIALSLWLILSAYLAYKSRKPTRGTLLNLVGASIIGIPIWAVWLGYLLAAGKLTNQAS